MLLGECSTGYGGYKGTHLTEMLLYTNSIIRVYAGLHAGTLDKKALNMQRRFSCFTMSLHIV